MSDFDDNLSDLWDNADPLAALLASPKRVALTPPASYQPKDFTEPCSKCRGRGRFISYAGRDVGPCFSCKGAGKMTFKSSATDRAASRDKAQAAKERKADRAWESFKTWQPEVAAWIVESEGTFEFARSMHEAVLKYGDLTERQLAACQSAVAKRKLAAEQRVNALVNAPSVDVGKLEAAFNHAREAGLKRIAMRMAGFKFAPAPESGRNAGSIYVTQGDVYLGRITSGQFISTRQCDEVVKAEVVKVASDPANAARAYGKQTGECSCCGRTLTDPISVANGIGPICADRFGL